MKARKIIIRFERFVGKYSKKLIMMTSLFFILFSAISVVDSGQTSFPMMSKILSYFTAPGLMASPQIKNQIKTISGTVKSGDTASSLLNTYIPLKTIYDLDNRSNKIFPLTRIRKGQPYKICLLEDSLVAFEYEIDKNDRLIIQKKMDSYFISKSPIEYEIKEETISVDIRTSLSGAVKRSGEYPSLTWKLADIFAWDIDFIRDIRPGDQFKVLVEKRYRNEKFSGYSDIKAAFFTNKGFEYKAFLYEDTTGRRGYYNEKGESLEKVFLRSPLNYSRISSSFSTRRFHPILKKYRAHPGVDYAAPKNTAIKTVADGVIASIGYNKSMGRNITIRHFSGYETSYFHMNKYAKGMKKNKKVVQGDVIGYVGKTGLATGYHLCFRMRKQGLPVNPLKQTVAGAKPVLQTEMDGFTIQTKKYSEKIEAARKMAHSTP
jgi:murein DD-endopeptidase MepM/ murein hydrolase activator NlpD